MRPAMFAVAARGEAFTLATIAAARGGPRRPGAQMVVTADQAWGFLSGGCIEEDVVGHARRTLADRQSRRLRYGRGSPYIDMRLPCGGTIDVLIQYVGAADADLARLRELGDARRPALWRDDAAGRRCVAGDAESDENSVLCRYEPSQQLLVVGSDPYALAIAALGQMTGWETLLLAPFGPARAPPHGIACDRRPLAISLADRRLDRWTAVAVATHDLELDEAALVPALRADTGYVGVLGARSKIPDRQRRLLAAGVPAPDIDRLHAPIGLPIDGHAPWEVAVAVIAEIVAERAARQRSVASVARQHAAA